jgi:hypothetical protein
MEREGKRKRARALSLPSSSLLLTLSPKDDIVSPTALPVFFFFFFCTQTHSYI